MVYYLGEVEPYDAIIVGDDAAFNFAVDNKDTLFKDIPIFFEGVNNDDKAVAVSASSQITGVIESLSYKIQLRLHQRLFRMPKRLLRFLMILLPVGVREYSIINIKIFIRNMSLMKLMHQN